MEIGKKAAYKAELMGLKAQLAGSSAAISQLSQAAYPVVGNMAMIHSLPLAANGLSMQADAVGRLMSLLERIVDDI